MHTLAPLARGAIEHAKKVLQKIILIDSEELARLMVRYEVGVRIERTVEIERLDLDSFIDSNEQVADG
jgi:restriction system protein